MNDIIQAVQDHLHEVTLDPSKPLDERVLGRLDTQLIGQSVPCS
jgi:hypothetical protein